MITYQDRFTLKKILLNYRKIKEEKYKGNEEAMIILADIERLLEEVGLTEQEEKILKGIQAGDRQQVIAEETGVAQSNISRTFNTIVNKLHKKAINSKKVTFQ